MNENFKKLEIGKFFVLDEFVRSETATKRKIKNVPNLAQIDNIKKLVSNVLEPMRETLGFPLKITSGFRCVELNNIVGGKPNSFHLRGLAADIIPGGKVQEKEFEKRLNLIGAYLMEEELDRASIYWKFYQDKKFFHIHLKK